MEKKENCRPLFERKRSFRDMQGVYSKIKLEVLKTVIENGSLVPSAPVSVPTTPMENQIPHPPFPVNNANLRLTGGYESENSGDGESAHKTMTIFYNGVVSVFDVSPKKAEEIFMKLVEGEPKSAESSDSNLSGTYEQQNLLASLNGDLPIARRMSLQRFLEKRKQRLTLVAQYGFKSKNS